MDNLDLMALLMAAAGADRQITPEEHEALLNWARLLVTPEEFERALAKAESEKAEYRLPTTQREAEDRLSDLSGMVVVDGKVDAAEMVLLIRLSAFWKVDGA